MQGGERHWLDTFEAIDEAIREATKQSLEGSTADQRWRTGLASSRLTEIRQLLWTQHMAWNATLPCRSPALL